jgi:hypothetical protein
MTTPKAVATVYAEAFTAASSAVARAGLAFTRGKEPDFVETLAAANVREVAIAGLEHVAWQDPDLLVGLSFDRGDADCIVVAIEREQGAYGSRPVVVAALMGLGRQPLNDERDRLPLTVVLEGVVPVDRVGDALRDVAWHFRGKARPADGARPARNARR